MGANVIIAAAGSANRMQGVDKILFKIRNKEVISYSIRAFLKAECTQKIIVVTSKEKIEKITKIAKKLCKNKPFEVIEGGKSRQESVFKAFSRCDNSDCVMIHDAARPMINSQDIDKLYFEVINNKKDAAALGVRVKDTIKITDDELKILNTPDRKTLFVAQTPQAFEFNVYKSAVENAKLSGADYTDDCQLVEAIGKPVYMVEGDYRNIKITTPEDILTAKNFLRR